MNCKTCVWWTDGDNDWNEILNPRHPVTYEVMETTFEVRECKHPKLLFCERPVEANGFAVADGSNYRAALYTAEDFGCVRHEVEG